MVLKIALLLSVIIQLGTAIIAMSMIKRTRFNVSWILISLGLLLMAFRRFADLAYLLGGQDFFVIKGVNSWIGVAVSVLMFISLFYIRRIFNLYDLLDEVRAVSEKRLLSAVIKGEEKVRESIAGDLHDGIAPLLSSLKMILSSVDLSGVDKENRKTIERGDFVIEEAITAIKEISNQLSPHLLRNYGMKKAITTFLNQFAGYGGLSVVFDMPVGDRRFSVDVEISLYRIVTELINNTLRHADALNVFLSIREEEGMLLLEYRDDGSGCDIGEGGVNDDSRGSRGSSGSGVSGGGVSGGSSGSGVSGVSGGGGGSGGSGGGSGNLVGRGSYSKGSGSVGSGSGNLVGSGSYSKGSGSVGSGSGNLVGSGSYSKGSGSGNLVGRGSYSKGSGSVGSGNVENRKFRGRLLSVASGMGLQNIRSRVKSLGGQCVIDSRECEGFYVFISVPLESSNNNFDMK